jgi:hypothetical protein
MKNLYKFKSEYSSNGIKAKVFYSKNSQIHEDFDLGIFFGTFESRGQVSSSLLKKSSCLFSIIVYFEDAKETSLRNKYDQLLKKQVQNCTKNPVIYLDQVLLKDISINLERLFAKIPRECLHLKAKWFLDIAGIPIPYFLAIIGYLRDIFPRPELTVFNATGSYDGIEEGFTFATGFDKNLWVPRFWGRPDPLLPRTYVFLLGFDGYRSHEVYYFCEPEKAQAVIADPGYKKEYALEPIERNKLFLRESGLWPDNSDPKIIKCHASDIVDIWRKLEALVVQEKNRSNVTFVPVGPKGHALGAGLCALADSRTSILYHMPRTFIVRDVGRGKYLWKYIINL